ncbi:MAG: YMGG-like glycine zipper-containing protein [Thermodesulfobacteriota bacterium]
MNKIASFFSIPTFLFLAACASYQPVVDTNALDDEEYNRYHRDVAECRFLAENNVGGTEEVAASTAGGAAIGAGTGALVGVIVGDTVEGLAIGAVIGGLEGFLHSVCHSDQEFEYIYRNCLIGRGYTVLN